MESTVWFKDGPCAGVERPITYPVSPPETLTCKGTTYTVLAIPDPRFIVYVVAGGPLDKQGTVIAGQRDVFAAWSRIHTVLNRTVPHKVNRIRQAGRRIRRAVR